MGYPIVTAFEQKFGIQDIDKDGNLVPTTFATAPTVTSSDPANVAVRNDPDSNSQFIVGDTTTAFVGDATIHVEGTADDGTAISQDYVVTIGVGAATGSQIMPVGDPTPRA